jgi:hypothetical protein
VDLKADGVTLAGFDEAAFVNFAGRFKARVAIRLRPTWAEQDLVIEAMLRPIPDDRRDFVEWRLAT